MSIVTAPRFLLPCSDRSFLTFSCSVGIISASVSFNDYHALTFAMQLINTAALAEEYLRVVVLGDDNAFLCVISKWTIELNATRQQHTRTTERVTRNDVWTSIEYADADIGLLGIQHRVWWKNFAMTTRKTERVGWLGGFAESALLGRNHTPLFFTRYYKLFPHSPPVEAASAARPSRIHHKFHHKCNSTALSLCMVYEGNLI
jgi:hypothetical protein